MSRLVLTLPLSLALLLLLHLSSPSPTLAASKKAKPKLWIRYSKVVATKMPSYPKLVPAGTVTGKAILSAPSTNISLHMYFKASGSFPGGVGGVSIPFNLTTANRTVNLYYRANARRPFIFWSYLKGNWSRASVTQMAFKSYTVIPPWLGRLFKVNPSNLALGLVLNSKFVSWGGVTLKPSA